MKSSSPWRKRLFRLLRPKSKLLRALRAVFFCAALTAAVTVYCALPPTLVVGGLALEARAAVVDAGQSASPLFGSAPDFAVTPDADVPPLADIERSEFARARVPMSSGAARILAEGNARQAALEAAAAALPNRRDIRMGADNAEERLALAAQLYTHVTRHHKDADGAPLVTVLLRPRPEAAARITQSLRSVDLMQVRSTLLGETASLLRLMNTRDPAHAGSARIRAAGNGNDPDVPLRGSGNLGTAYRAPVGMHDATGVGSGGAHGGDARKNALDEIFSGCAGTGAGARPAPAASGGTTSTPSDDAMPAAVQPSLPSLDDAVWTERHWEAASDRLQALLRAQDLMEADAEGWLVPDGVLPRLERASARLPQSPTVWLLLAEAQLRRGLPLQSVASCDAALALAPGLNRARYIRALGHWRLQQLALAEDDLTSSLDARHGLAPQGEDRARRLRARGAVRMQRRDLTGMCEDFGAACALGECEGLILARAQEYCLPSAPAGTGAGAETRQHDSRPTPDMENKGQRGAEDSPSMSRGPRGPHGPDTGGGARP